MIIMRGKWKVKFGCEDEAIKLNKAAVEELGFTPRVSTHRWGSQTTAGIVTSDLEFETMEDMDKFLDDIDTSQPAWVEWHKRYVDLIESHWSELLQVH